MTSTAIIFAIGSPIVLMSVPAMAQTIPDTGSSTYQTTATTTATNDADVANTASPIPGGSSIAIGIAANSSSPTTGGDSIAIGTNVTANNQDSIAIGAQTTASGENTIAIGNGDIGGGGTNGERTDAMGTNSIAFGGNSQAVGVGAVTFGNGTTATPDGSIALGYLSVADRAGLNGGTEAFSGTAVNSPYGALSIGTVGGERQIENVAGGTQDTDAVNVRQLRTVGNNAATALGGGSGYDPNTDAYTAPTYTVGGKNYNNVASAMTASNNLSVQYTPDGNGNPTNVVDLTKGGNLAPVSVTGLAPATTGSGAVSLSQLPLQYSTAGAPTTANPAVASNDVTLIGTGAGQTVTLHNVKAGALTAGSTDAVDGGQLYTTNQNEAADATNITTLKNGVDNGTEGLVQQNPGTQAITVGAATGGTVVNFANNAGTARTLTGVAAGNLAANSTDATNGSQLFSTDQRVTSLETGTAGLVQQNPATRDLTVGANTDGTDVNFANSSGTARTLSDVAAGQIGAGSTQAINGGQAYNTANSVANNFGGGSVVNADGTVSAPSYSVQGTAYNNVGGAIGGLDAAVTQNQTTDTATIASLRSGLDNGTEGLVQQDPATQAITVGAATGGTIVNFTNSAGTARTLTGVAAGNLSATSTDATNGSQLYATNEQVASLEDGAAGLVQQNAVTRNITVGASTDGTNIDLTNDAGATRSLSGVTAGTLSATSTQAVNGSQLYATNQMVTGIENGTLGLVQQNATTGDITVGAATNGTDVNFANLSGAARTLSNVAAGQIAAGSTQAINGGQAYNTANSVANNFGGGSVVNADGTISAPSYTVQGATYNNVGGAIGGLDSAVDTINTRGSKYFAVNSTGVAASAVGTDTVAIGPNSTATADQGVALGANSVASRAGLNGAQEMFSDTSVASTAGAVSVGDVGAERQITNVAGGTAPTDAVNVRQLTAVNQQVATVFGGGASLNADGTLNAPTYNVDGKQYADVGSAVTALDNTGVKYDVDPATGAKTNSISLQGGDPDQPVLIKNVANGQAAGDAANTGQVATAKAQAMAYTDTNIAAVEGQLGGVNNQLASLQSQVDQNRREARQGAAIGLAAASLRYDDKPGKLSTSIGGGLWKGEYATAMGVGYSLPNGWARLSANGVTTGRDFGIGAGASFTLN